MRVQGWQIILLVVIVLLLFGANRLPDLARSVGKSLKILKSEVKDLTSDDESHRDERPRDTGTGDDDGDPGTTRRSGPDGSTGT